MFFGEGRQVVSERGGPAGADGDARTRDLVLRHISELGPVTAATVAGELGLTTPAVRRHLELLTGDGLIATSDRPAARRGRGRPARAYVVTPEGHRALSSDYGDVATDALRFLADRLGEEAVSDFARDRLSVLERRYAPIVDQAGDDVERRAHALAEALAADGYAASARPAGGMGLQLCQGHCPMHEVAARFPQFCEQETALFARLLGARVQRLATLAGGEHVCTTFVPTGPVPVDPPGPRPTEQNHRHHHRHDEGSAR